METVASNYFVKMFYTFNCILFVFRLWQEQVCQFFGLSFRERSWSSILQLKVNFLGM